MPRERVVLVDGSALIFRAFFAIPTDLKTTAGLHTNAVFGFARMFARIFAGRRPRYGAVVFDAPSARASRVASYPAYKATRATMPGELVEQLPWIDRVVEAHDFPMLRVPGVEADDVIGTLCAEALALGHEVWIVSGDKDFAQLVGEHVRMDDPVREVLYDAELVRKRWGVPPARFVDWLALVGDKADNIPGVPGIGAKGAADLLNRLGSLDAVLGATDLPPRTRAALDAHRHDALLSRELATIRPDVPLPVGVEGLALPPPDTARIDAVYRELEFWSMLKERPAVEVADYGAVTTDAELGALLAALPDEPVAIVPMHDAPSALVGALAGIAVAVEPGVARYVPLPGRLTKDGGKALRGWLQDPARPKVAHSVRDAYTVLRRHGIELRGCVGDTALASYLLDPTLCLPHRLDQVAREVLHENLQPTKEITGAGQKTRSLRELSLDALAPHACHLADAVLRAWQALAPRLEAQGLTSYLREVDLPLCTVLGRMQLTGVPVDAARLAHLGEVLSGERARVEARLFAHAGHAFNPGSLEQLSTVLYEELGLPVLKKTKKGYSTAADVLERLHHPINPDVLRWREVSKLIDTYTTVLQAAVDTTTNRIHPTFQQTVSASGRLITTDPDLQRTPVRTPEGRAIREAFVAAPGAKLISADWSQIELRLLAHVTKDPLLLDAFRAGDDVHARTAREIFGHEPSPSERNVGKTVNFATIYGQGATALAQQLGLPRAEAAELIERYFRTYAGVRRWLDETVRAAHATGSVTTLLGRKRIVRELSARNDTDRSYGERIAANTPIQGSAADICKVAMLHVAAALEARGLRARMVLQIHDELLLEAPEEEVEEVSAIVRACMEHVVELDVPLVVDVGVGQSWAEAHQ